MEGVYGPTHNDVLAARRDGAAALRKAHRQDLAATLE
jgi:hypothetical protein